MSPTTTHANQWRTGLIALLMLAMLTAAVPVRAQPLGLGFSDACPAELEATAQANGTILLEVNASSEAMLYRDGTSIAQVNGTTYTDADVQAGVTYTYHITLLVQGQETPPCDEVAVTAKADADAQSNATGNATIRGQVEANATAGNNTASVDAAAVLEACPASLHATARADGSILLHVNASAAVDAVHVLRAQAGEDPVKITTLAGSATHLDLETEAEQAYTYSLVIVVDGQVSEVCDTLELTSVPVFHGAGAVIATGIAGLAYLVRRRGA